MGEKMTRTILIAECATNHGGDWGVAKAMIDAAVGAGADVVKFQLFDAAMLKDDDPQREWFERTQMPENVLRHLKAHAEGLGAAFLVSVFGVPQAHMAHDAGVRAVKLGSGEMQRDKLRLRCRDLFECVMESKGLESGLLPARKEHAAVQIIPFYGVSQYPTPYIRGYAALMQAHKQGHWGWSDHGDNLEVAKEAMCQGAEYVERHFNFNDMRNRGGRPFADHDTSPAMFAELRSHAEACAWGLGNSAYDAARQSYVGRWREQ
jgi:N,N'-diacetyllegionaminate synthase